MSDHGHPKRARRNAAILFDFENFKIAWQMHYRTVLSYFDICALINKMEEVHDFNVIALRFYCTATSSIKERTHRQLQELTDRFSASNPTSNLGRLQLLTINRVVNTMTKELKAYQKLLDMFMTDQSNTKTYALDLFEENPDKNSERWFTRLGGINKENDRRCKIDVQEFELKWQDGRRVQRGCDNAIVRDLVSVAEHPSVDSIILMSGDSDFIQSMQQCKERCESHNKDMARSVGPKSFSMCSYLASFPVDIRKLFTIHQNQSHIMSPEGIEYCRLERAFAEVNPQCPNYESDEEKWLVRTPIPAGYYDGDLPKKSVNSRKHGSSLIPEELVKNYQAALRRLEKAEGKKTPAYNIGKLKVSDMLRNWPDPDSVVVMPQSPPKDEHKRGGPDRSSSRPRVSSSGRQSPYTYVESDARA